MFLSCRCIAVPLHHQNKEGHEALKVIGVLFRLGIAAVGIIWWYSRTSNPWNAKCVGDISSPVGYTRVNGSYAEFMRSLPLKKRGFSNLFHVPSKRRNPLLADFFNRLDLMERRDSGMKKFLAAQRGIYKLISVNPHITIVGMAKELGVSDRQIKKYLQRLTELKLIERQGGRKNGTWHIIDKDYERIFEQ